MLETAVVSGYATLDYCLNLAGPFNGRNIAHIEPVDQTMWARPGGGTLYTSLQLARYATATYPLIWLGDDPAGQRYLQHCQGHGLRTHAVQVLKNKATPSCFLIYQQDGSQGCLIDNGETGETVGLSAAQVETVEQADLVCITAGPPQQTLDVLAHTKASAFVAWIAKRDEKCFPSALQEKLGERADIIFCNASERSFVNAAIHKQGLRKCTVIETRGADGILIEAKDGFEEIAVQPLASEDTTGAGDTFAGATLGALLSGANDIKGAVAAGEMAAHAMLKSRL
ncbi:MAG: PfkB family carbohydrate kinase [Pseudomonadota bacterium]